MRDTVLAGWGELLPLLVFILLGWLANRAKQKKEEELLGKPGQITPPGTASGQPAPARSVPARQVPHPIDDGENVEDWTGEDWDGEHSERWGDTQGGEERTEKPRPAENRVERLRPGTPSPVSRTEDQRSLPKDRDAGNTPLIPPKAKEKAAEVGKDLLSQLAKELGLELPQGKPVPRPAPKPAPAQPAKPASAPRSARTPEGQPHAHVPRSHAVSPDEVRARAAESNRTQPRTASFQAAAAPAPWAKPLVSPSELADAEAMRKAVILKTILDKPQAFKPRGRKRN